MSEKTIGAQLDALGLAVDLQPGERVLEATVNLVTGTDDVGEHHRPISLPRQQPGAIPVPHPVERRVVTVVAQDQEISEEQRCQVVDWLRANDVDPSLVVGPITVESTMRGDQEGTPIIGFTEYYEDPQGRRVLNEKTLDGALTFERWVRQQVPLEPDPEWKGWDAHRAAQPRETGDQ